MLHSFDFTWAVGGLFCTRTDFTSVFFFSKRNFVCSQGGIKKSGDHLWEDLATSGLNHI